MNGASIDISDRISYTESDDIATKLAILNPFRYRSYYFDIELGYYYLQSRYYDPQVGRFISMDQVEYLAPDIINGLNLYAYCLNNLVTASDPTGTWVQMRRNITKGSVLNMSFETMRKGLGSTIVSSIPTDIFYGVKFANYKRARMEILLPMMYGRSNGGENGQYITAR
ncbi:MAG: RHS repeat-associated core domain-containing protein [Clostridia bacterium]|nr:RHS repeat-associated core domain-containing protein [Clostridia bacterium]